MADVRRRGSASGTGWVRRGDGDTRRGPPAAPLARPHRHKVTSNGHAQGGREGEGGGGGGSGQASHKADKEQWEEL